jgi:GT2 family glycosyltransferase
VKVSFIIPLYNRLDLTQPCLASLQATIPRGLDHEIVLVDDSSTDGTREWIQTLGTPFRILLNERNLGYAATNNRGAAAATGDILALLNSDLVLTPRWLEPMLAVLRRHRRAGIVGNVQFRAATGELDHIGFDIGLTGKPHHDESLHWLWAPWSSRRTSAVTAACLLVPRDLFLQLRGFDEGFRNGGEDVDLCFRARALGRTCHVALHSHILHHVSASPGRKLRDEENSRRLAHRWRDELIRLSGQRFNRHYGLPWSIDYLRRYWDDPRDFDRIQVLGTLLFLLGLRDYPQPWLAQHHIEDFQQEIDHWDRTLGPLPPMEFVSSLPPVITEASRQ